MKRLLLFFSTGLFLLATQSCSSPEPRELSGVNFWGTGFNAASKTERSSVIKKIDGYLRAHGFQESAPPSIKGFMAPPYPLNPTPAPIIYSRPSTTNSQLFAFISFLPRSSASLTMRYNWLCVGSELEALRAQQDAYRFALEMDDWLAAIPRDRTLEGNGQQRQRERLERRVKSSLLRLPDTTTIPKELR